jgi:hypothetical protein
MIPFSPQAAILFELGLAVEDARLEISKCWVLRSSQAADILRHCTAPGANGISRSRELHLSEGTHSPHNDELMI